MTEVLGHISTPYSKCLFNLPIRDQCKNQTYLPWISQAIMIKPELKHCCDLSYVIFHASEPDSACEPFAKSSKYRNWTTFLKSTINIQVWISVDKQWCLLSGSVETSWSQWFNPSQNSVKIFYKLLCSLPHVMLSKLFNKYKKGPLLETDTYSLYKRQAQRHTQTTTGTVTGTSRLTRQSSDRHRFRFI